MTAIRFVLLFTLALAIVACNESVPPPPGGGTGATSGNGGSGGRGGDTGKGGTAGNAASGGTGGTGGGGGGTAGTGGVALMGACNNVDDASALTDLLPINARQVAARCDEDTCDQTGQEGLTTCVSNCVERTVFDLSSRLSAVCSSCYGEFEWCNRDCSTVCAADSCSSECESCTDGTNCTPSLRSCTGPTPVDCGEA